MNNKSVFVWQLSVFNLNNKIVFSGVLIMGKKRRAKSSEKIWNHLKMISGSYFSKPYSNKNITLDWSEKKLHTSTNDKGAFLIETDEILSPEFSILVENGIEILSKEKSSDHFYFIKESNLTIVSDIDDTILVSRTGKGLKSTFTTLFRPYHKRRVILFTQNLFRSFEGQNPNHFYVSRSEMNLYPLLTSFVKHNSFPKGPLLLTPFLNFKELLAGSKDPDFKYLSIEWIIQQSPIGKFILVGDDSQHDIEIYTRIAKNFKTRVTGVYIRQTNSKYKVDETTRWDELCKFVPNAIYFGTNEL